MSNPFLKVCCEYRNDAESLLENKRQNNQSCTLYALIEISNPD